MLHRQLRHRFKTYELLHVELVVEYDKYRQSESQRTADNMYIKQIVLRYIESYYLYESRIIPRVSTYLSITMSLTHQN